ncbi:MAG: RNA 2',3'-cyclic phosphodiesterase [Candidatus Anstonellaceae archaeon]
MRCFIAFLPSATQLSELEEFQNKLKSHLNGWRLTQPEKLHLTFLFLGNNVQESDIENILNILKKASQFKKFEAQGIGFGAFPSPNFASVLWCGLKGKELLDLATFIRKELEGISFKDNKPFKPHFTIARTIKNQNVSDLVKKFSSVQWAKNNWVVDNITLMQSVPSNKGYVYKIIQKFPLK